MNVFLPGASFDKVCFIFILRVRVKLATADASDSMNVVAFAYEAEKLIGFTAYLLSQSEYEVCFNLVVRGFLSITRCI